MNFVTNKTKNTLLQQIHNSPKSRVTLLFKTQHNKKRTYCSCNSLTFIFTLVAFFFFLNPLPATWQAASIVVQKHLFQPISTRITFLLFVTSRSTPPPKEMQMNCRPQSHFTVTDNTTTYKVSSYSAGM